LTSVTFDFEKGKAAERQRRKTTDLKPKGHDRRVAVANFHFHRLLESTQKAVFFSGTRLPA
jgi:hypothetical protein